MKRLQIPQKLVYKIAVVNKFCVHEIAAVNLSKIYFKNLTQRKHVN